MKSCLAILGLLFPLLGLSQLETDIYLLEVDRREVPWRLIDSKNITPRQGYDNQPFFMPEGRSLLFVSADSRLQTDIYLYDIEAGSARRITRTKDLSEYSPQLMPDEKHVSAVVVERDSTQRIWQYPLGEGKRKVLIPKVDSIGYYSWVDKKRLGLFVLTDPISLQLANKRKAKVITTQVGRSLHTQPGTDTLTFVQKDSVHAWFIRAWHRKTKEINTLAPTLPGQEDFAWTPEGDLLMGDGEMLYAFTPGRDEEWRPVLRPEVGNFYRVAMSPDGRYLALVVYK